MADKSKKAVVGTCYKTCTLQFRVGTFSRNVFLMLQNGQLGTYVENGVHSNTLWWANEAYLT